MEPALTIARLMGPVLAIIGIGMLTNGVVYRQMASQFLTLYPLMIYSVRRPGPARRPHHPQQAPRLDARLAQPHHRRRLDLHLRRHLPHPGAAIRHLCRRHHPHARRFFRRRRHRPARARRFHHLERLCGVSAVVPNRRQDNEQARHHCRSGHPEGHDRFAARFAQGLRAAGGCARAARAGARDHSRSERQRTEPAGLRHHRRLFRSGRDDRRREGPRPHPHRVGEGTRRRRAI